MPGKDKRLKSFEIIDKVGEIDKVSSAFVIPINDQEADIVIVDDIGQKRTVKSGGGDKHFIFTQIQPATIWTIEHPLNKKPAVTVTDTAGTEVEGRVTISNSSKVVIEFNFPFNGEVLLN